MIVKDFLIEVKNTIFKCLIKNTANMYIFFTFFIFFYQTLYFNQAFTFLCVAEPVRDRDEALCM